VSLARGIGFSLVGLAVSLLVFYVMAASARIDCVFWGHCLAPPVRALLFFGSPVAGVVAMALFWRWLRKCSRNRIR
jgi:hypothetical protein